MTNFREDRVRYLKAPDSHQIAYIHFVHVASNFCSANDHRCLVSCSFAYKQDPHTNRHMSSNSKSITFKDKKYIMTNTHWLAYCFEQVVCLKSR